ncbi:aminotransferase class V-fold PLP-dependent enzyme [Nisaea sp.]|uniref:aminotransferase class V-fold PLP-dependent enzyme n=1 Tax=Nisaea sp. TaxID=2024842 RepID=UPI003266EB7D
MTEIDVARLRAETRGCENVVHLNNAGASLPPAPVADHLYAYLRDEEMKGGYETADLRHDELEHFYVAAARLLNASPEEIAFVENATRAWDMAFYAFPFKSGDRILTTVAEYGSNLIAYLQQARKTGAELVVVPNDEHGQIDLEQLEALIDERVKLISISHIPTGGGLVNPAAAVGRIARKHGVPYLLDACQSAGQMRLDVEELGCDMLSVTGRKYLRGPRGTGFLYVRKNWIEKLEPPFLDQHAAELIDSETFIIRRDVRRFENWERFFAGQAALGTAIDYAMDIGLEAIQDRVFSLAATLRAGLADTPGIRVADEGLVKCGLVTFQHDRLKCEEIKAAMSQKGFNMSVSNGSGTKLSFMARGLEAGLVRTSVHYFNTDDELERFLGVLRSL